MINNINLKPQLNQNNIYINNNVNKNRYAPNYQNTNFLARERKKINFTEGLYIYTNGLFKQAKEICTSIVKHPIKTIAIAGTTSLALLALPLIGIPSAVGAGVLAIGFAGYSTYKSTVHTINFIKNNKRGNYNLAKNNLEKLGEDTIDLALSIPFLPKAITRIKNFAKYGKISFNQTMLKDLRASKSYQEEFIKLRNYDKNLNRNINYQSIVDKTIAKIKNLTDTEKTILRQYVLEYNVPIEDIPKVTLNQWARTRNIHTQPHLAYTTLPKDTGGLAVTKDCSIILNDYKTTVNNNTFSQFKQISSRFNGYKNQYEITYLDTKTGNTFVETIEKDILDNYNLLYAREKELSKEAQRILVTIHEREHIHDYAQIIAQKGENFFTLTNEGKNIYNSMIAEMPKVQPNSPQAEFIEKLANAKNNGTAVSYIKNFREINARNAETAALNDPNFAVLDQIFKDTNKIGTPSLKETILLNTLRPESAIS